LGKPEIPKASDVLSFGYLTLKISLDESYSPIPNIMISPTLGEFWKVLLVCICTKCMTKDVDYHAC